MRSIFITAALLLFACATAKEENVTKPLTEEEEAKIVFSVEKEMAIEIDEAVKTINEVFGSPPCNDGPTKPAPGIQKGFGEFWKGAPPKALAEKRSEPVREVKKRGWSHFWGGVAAGAILLGKRSDSQSESESVAEKRSEPVRELEVKKRGWGHFWAGVAAGALFLGKRSDSQSESEVEKRWSPWPYSKRSEEKNDSDDSPKAENEFRADIAKLERALEVLNDVLQIAKATVKSEKSGE